MLLTILVLSAVLLSITVTAGLLTFYQLRGATSVMNSVKAIYAAETGIELELYRWEKQRDVCHGNPLPQPPAGQTLWSPNAGTYPVNTACHAAPSLQNGATYETRIAYGLTQSAGVSATGLSSVKSTGQAGTAARALQVQF